MKEPSNLPPGVTDRMVEEQAGAYACPEHDTAVMNKEKYDELFQELERTIDEAYERYDAAWHALHAGDGVMLNDVPPPDDDAIARRVVKKSLGETTLVAVVRHARALGEWEQAAEWDDDCERNHSLNVASLLSWRLAVLSLVNDGGWGANPEEEAEQFLSRLFSQAAFQESE